MAVSLGRQTIAMMITKQTKISLTDMRVEEVSDEIRRRISMRDSMVSAMRSSESAIEPPTCLLQRTAAHSSFRSWEPVRRAMFSSAATVSPSTCM